MSSPSDSRIRAERSRLGSAIRWNLPEQEAEARRRLEVLKAEAVICGVAPLLNEDERYQFVQTLMRAK